MTGVSLQRRLAVRIGGLFLLTTLAAIGFAVLRVRELGPALDRRSLHAQFAAVETALAVGLDGAPFVATESPALTDYGGRPADPLYAVYDAGGRLIASSPGADGERILSHLPDNGDGFFQFRPQQTNDFGDLPTTRDGLAGHSEATGAPVEIAVIEAANPDDELLDVLSSEATEDLLYVGIPFTIFTGLIGIATIRGSLSVVSDVSRTAARIGLAPPGLRLDRPDIPSEVRPLVQAVDRILDRLEGAIDAQRRFTAEAAHQLRTPLAIALARLDQAPGGMVPEAALRDDLARLERLVGQLLAAARAEAGLYAGAENRLSALDLARDAVESMVPLALNRHSDLGIEEHGDFTVAGNRAALEGMLGNLIENALDHSPPETQVDVVVDGRARSIAVADRGPGVPPELRERIFERFWTSEKPSGRSGTGLGLFIARSIAASHGASVAISDRPGGGAIFTVTWTNKEKDLT
ncbi:sensor histidine kinase [Zavarzinia sp.]|uniref:sensor histidine kinase n=1 Tax=Zavarzinia sp. TaxID=2027920 RepID=UPI0035686C9D